MNILDSVTSLFSDAPAQDSAAKLGTGNTSFWGGLVDDFSTIADKVISYENAKNPAKAGFFWRQNQMIYLILASLYDTCLRTTGSNFLISSFSGIVRLFLVVV